MLISTSEGEDCGVASCSDTFRQNPQRVKIAIKMPKQKQLTGKENSLVHSSVAIHLPPVSRNGNRDTL